MLIDAFLQKGKEFLDCRYPIMCGAMTWVSDPKLVTAVGKACGFGLLAGGNAPVEMLKDQILQTRNLSDHPFGVNLITLAPVYRDQLEMVCDLKCKVVVFAGGIPRKKEIHQAKQAGARTICFAPTAPLAHKLDRGDIDRQEAQYAVERFWVGALRDAVVDGDVTKGSLMAGQSVGLTNRTQPLDEIIAEMIDDAETELNRLKAVFDKK